MRSGRLAALFLLLLASSSAFAESPPPPATPPPAPTPPPLVELPPPANGSELAREGTVSGESAPAKFSRWPRIGVEAVAGLGVGAVAGLAAAELGGRGGEAWAFLGAPVGMALGILAGGYLMDGDGSVLAVIGGEAGGGFAGVLLASALFSGSYNPTPIYVTIALGALAGGVFMYELTSNDQRSARERLAPGFSRLDVAPFLAPTVDGRGGLMGLVLRL